MTRSTTIKNASPQTSDLARVAGRGTAYITAAKIWFMASGYAIMWTLPRLLSDEEFGIYKVVIGIVSIVNAVVVTGTSQTVSKYISQEEGKADSVKAEALKLQSVLGSGIALGFFLLAPVVAHYLNDTQLANHLRLASLITLSYSFYSVYTGYFNGQKKFLAQAGLDITYSTLKLVLIVSLVALGYGVTGGVGGFALAAVLVLAVSAVVARGGSRRGQVRARDLLKFQVYLLLFTLVLNLLQKVDLILIKALSSPDAVEASKNAGYYGAAIDIANITYQVIISVTFVIFPLVSEATFANDRVRARGYITNTLRYTLMIMALIATLFSANASEVLHVIYPDRYQAASLALAIVAYGILCYGLFYVVTTIITASGSPKVSLAIAAVTLVTSAALNAALIPRYGLAGAAAGTTAAMVAGVIAGCAYLYVQFGALMNKLSLARITACAALVYAGSLALKTSSKPLIIAELALLSLVYVIALVVTRELGRGDLDALKRVVKI